MARVQPLGQSMAVAAVRTENYVIRAEMGTDADGYGFLADVGVASAVDQAALVRPGQLLLGAPDKEHAAKEGQEYLFVETGWRRCRHAGVQLQ
jgi:hypothetical protein